MSSIAIDSIERHLYLKNVRRVLDNTNPTLFLAGSPFHRTFAFIEIFKQDELVCMFLNEGFDFFIGVQNLNIVYSK